MPCSRENLTSDGSSHTGYRLSESDTPAIWRLDR